LTNAAFIFGTAKIGLGRFPAKQISKIAELLSECFFYPVK